MIIASTPIGCIILSKTLKGKSLDFVNRIVSILDCSIHKSVKLA